MALRHFFAGLAVVFLCSAFAAAAVHLVSFPKRFRWSASINRSTGVAQSREESCITPNQSTALKRRKKIKAVDLFSVYPFWLSRGRTTLGILQTITEKRNDNNDSAVVVLKDRMFGLPILKFGQPRRQGRNSMKLPIVGGLMARPGPSQNYGSLYFALENDCIVSEIKEYRPALAGSEPCHWLRAAFYRSMQSSLHAYVMWRFHGYCQDQILRNKSK